jgi:hypothetical protein
MVAVAQKTFTLNGAVTTTATNPKDMIQEVATELAASGGTWSVVDNDAVSTNGRQILLKSSDPDMANVKLALFGGETPHASAIVATSSAATIYAALHVNHPGDNFDNNFTSGQPLAGTGYIPGVHKINPSASFNRIRILRKGDLLCATFYDVSDANPLHVIIFGCIGRDLDGNQIMGVIGNGYNTTLSSTFWGTASTAGGLLTPNTTLTSTGANNRAWLDNGVVQVGRLWSTIEDAKLAVLVDPDGDKYFTSEIPIIDANGNVRGYFNQMRVGRNATLWQQFTSDGGRKYYTLSASPSSAVNALWFADP